LSRLEGKIVVIKYNLQALFYFYTRKSIFDHAYFFPNKGIKEEKSNKNITLWVNLIDIVEKKNLLSKEYKKRKIQEICTSKHVNFSKKKLLLLRKYKKFYGQYLKTTLNVTNNLLIWKFYEPLINLKRGNLIIVLIKTINYCLYNLRSFGKQTTLFFGRKEIKGKYSISRALFLSKNIYTANSINTNRI